MRRDDWLIWQLPVGMTEDDFFVRFVTIFQKMADTVLDQVDNLPYMFDPNVAPDDMVRQMGAWIGVDWIDSSLDDRLQRQIVLGYAELIRWRGTKKGLRMLLKLLTGGPAEVQDSGGVFAKEEAPGGAPHVRLDVTRTGWNNVDDLIRIVRAELPAMVTFDLWVGPDQVWPQAEVERPDSAARPTAPAAVRSDLPAPDAPSAADESGESDG